MLNKFISERIAISRKMDENGIAPKLFPLEFVEELLQKNPETFPKNGWGIPRGIGNSIAVVDETFKHFAKLNVEKAYLLNKLQ